MCCCRRDGLFILGNECFEDGQRERERGKSLYEKVKTTLSKTAIILLDFAYATHAHTHIEFSISFSLHIVSETRRRRFDDYAKSRDAEKYNGKRKRNSKIYIRWFYHDVGLIFPIKHTFEILVLFSDVYYNVCYVFYCFPIFFILPVVCFSFVLK